MVENKKLAGFRILLVEDEPACRNFIFTLLKNEGAGTTITEDGEHAIKLLQTSVFDVVVADIILPGISGIGLLEHIRTISNELPVIMITGYGSINSAVEALKLGAHDYLAKPLGDGTQLINSIRKAIEHYNLITRNKSLQEQLRQSEETFRTLFNNASDAIFLSHLKPDGAISTFLEVNNAACSMLGYSMNELRSLTMPDITDSDHRNDLDNIIKSLHTLEHTTLETIQIRRNGEKIPVEISIHTFSLHNKTAVLSIARNIAERREMEKHIAEETEKESKRIGQELHDVLCQNLVSINMINSVLKETLKSEASTGIKDAELISELISNAITSTRLLCAGLSPTEMEGNDLASSLEHLAIYHSRLFRIPCAFTNKSTVTITDKSVALHLYRIAQQAINNACKHSMAKNISICLADKGAGVVLTVKDDGIGIHAGSNHRHNGMGLNIMKYRARIIGAVLTISEQDTSGSTVKCSWS